MTPETFELFMHGGATEKRYRKMRPEVEKLPWGTLDPSKFDAPLVLEARKSWTSLRIRSIAPAPRARRPFKR